LFLTDNTTFEKFSMNNMDISDNVIKRRNVEANNLKDSFAPLSASKYILSNMRINNAGKKLSLTFNTSRINELGRKVDMENYLFWISKVVDKIKDFSEEECYLDHFSSPISFSENITKLKPRSMLLILNDLKIVIENNLLREVYYEYKGKRKLLNINKIIDSFLNFHNIEIDNLGNKKRYRIVNALDKTLQLKINKTQ